jgi:uncharacterized protein (TIGR02217 family)
MANDFDDVRLPEDIERGAVGGPGFRTTVITLVGGGERRNQEYEQPRGVYNIGYGIQKRAQMERIYAFFHARRGRARAFRFRDWIDFKTEGSPVGLVAGQPNQRQLIRVYADEIVPFVRVITHPVAATVEMYVGLVKTNDWTLLPNGIVQFNSDPGPDVLASFEFDIPVRFDLDDMSVRLNSFQEGSFPSISISEIIP